MGETGGMTGRFKGMGESYPKLERGAMTEQSFEAREASVPVDDVEGVHAEPTARDAVRETSDDVPVEGRDETDAYRQ
jgi:hypothetical protein